VVSFMRPEQTYEVPLGARVITMEFTGNGRVWPKLSARNLSLRIGNMFWVEAAAGAWGV
jgi:hypothetical protein